MSSYRKSPVSVQSKTTIGQSVKEGFGLGLGSAVAQRVVTAVLGPPRIATEVTPAPSPPPIDLWVRCLEQTQYDTEKCAQFKPAEKK